MKIFLRPFFAPLGAVLLLAAPALGATLRVSGNGVDSGTCGTGPNPPCATIQQAVNNAAAGDSIQVGPGSYAGATVSKQLKLWSGGGTGGALITSPMTLGSDGIVFGLLGKGFALDVGGSPNNAILVSGNGITVRGNRVNESANGVVVNGSDAVVRDNSFNACSTFAILVNGADAQIRGNRTGFSGTGGVGLSAASSGADVRENRMFGPSGTGIQIDGSGHLVRRNVVQGSPNGISSFAGGTPSGVQLVENFVTSQSLGYWLTTGTGWVLTKNAAVTSNAPGFYLTAGGTFTLTGNVAIGNVGNGFFLSGGSGHVLVDNTALNTIVSGGGTGGIVLANVGAGVTISGGNLYGNGNNCGVYNDATSALVTVDKVYWGAASGPGADPADTTCGTGGVNVTNPASKPATIKIPPLK